MTTSVPSTVFDHQSSVPSVHADHSPTPVDVERLRLIGIGQYVVGAISLWSSFNAFAMAGKGSQIIAKLVPSLPASAAAAFDFQKFLTVSFLAMGGLLAVTGIGSLFAARFIRARRHRSWCLAVGAMGLMQYPLGTLISLGTLLVLGSSRAKAWFS